MDQQEVFITMALRAWETELTRAGNFIAGLSDEQYFNEVAPGRNRAIYLIGHLIVVNDSLFEILGTGKRLYPEWSAVFVQNPDKSDLEMPSVSDLKTAWEQVHEGLKTSFVSLSPADWFSRHHAMTDQDFEADPSRNKLSVLLGRIRHLAYHMGQLKLLK